MLTGCVLPPIVLPPSPTPLVPVATFFNVPRRYVKSTMQIGNTSSKSLTEDVKPSRSLRKSSRIIDARPGPTSNPLQRTQDEDVPSPTVTSPRTKRKRLASLEEVVNSEDFIDNNSPPDLQSPRSATSTGWGEFPPHVCLCQPEPKIPRPRNGESLSPLSKIAFPLNQMVRLAITKEASFVCGC
jgi:hypothetical protein